MDKIEFEVSLNLTDAMDKLRMICFPSVNPVDSSCDEFDDRSSHVLIKINREIAAYGRLTPGPYSVFESWTKGAAEIPTGSHVVDLGRCLVAPSFRGLKLFSLVCLESLIVSAERGFTDVVGAVIPSREYACALYAIGFSNSGPVVNVKDSGGNNDCIQPLLSKCADVEKWKNLKRAKLVELKNCGYEAQ